MSHFSLFTFNLKSFIINHLWCIMKNLYTLEKVYSENFYYWHFSNKHATAKVYFWIFENKVSIEDFQVFQKRKHYGTKLFIYILKFLLRRGIHNFYISSRNTQEAQLFWKNMTSQEFNAQKFDNLIQTKQTLEYLKNTNKI